MTYLLWSYRTVTNRLQRTQNSREFIVCIWLRAGDLIPQATTVCPPAQRGWVPWWQSTACRPIDMSKWFSASGCRCTRKDGVRTGAAEPSPQTPGRSLQSLCLATSSEDGKIEGGSNTQPLRLFTFIKGLIFITVFGKDLDKSKK